MTPRISGSPEHVKYVVRSGWEGWIVYGVRKDGWHDRVACCDTRSAAYARAEKLQRALEARG